MWYIQLTRKFVKGTHIYNIDYHRNNILKNETYMSIFRFKKDFQIYAQNWVTIFLAL